MTVVHVRRDGDACDITVHVWRPTAEVDDRGYFVDVDHHLATFRMRGIREWTLPAGYGADTLFELRFNGTAGAVSVEIESAIDAAQNGRILCAHAALAQLVPCGPKGEVA
jgi:hypothetical protein